MMTSQLCITVVATQNVKKGWDSWTYSKPRPSDGACQSNPEKDNRPYMTLKPYGKEIPNNKELRRVSI